MTDQEYAEKKTKLFDDNQIPIELRQSLSHFAYEKAHAYGYDEIFIYLSDLVDSLEKPIKDFEKRIRIDANRKCLSGYR